MPSAKKQAAVNMDLLSFIKISGFPFRRPCSELDHAAISPAALPALAAILHESATVAATALQDYTPNVPPPPPDSLQPLVPTQEASPPATPAAAAALTASAAAGSAAVPSTAAAAAAEEAGGFSIPYAELFND
eukprot:1143653-Pelagomonas_calceolata.AAC.6